LIKVNNLDKLKNATIGSDLTHKFGGNFFLQSLVILRKPLKQQELKDFTNAMVQ
jgi:hypothetical protein